MLDAVTRSKELKTSRNVPLMLILSLILTQGSAALTLLLDVCCSGGSFHSCLALPCAQHGVSGEEESPGGGVHCVDCAGIGSPERILTLVRFGNWQGMQHGCRVLLPVACCLQLDLIEGCC